MSELIESESADQVSHLVSSTYADNIIPPEVSGHIPPHLPAQLCTSGQLLSYLPGQSRVNRQLLAHLRGQSQATVTSAVSKVSGCVDATEVSDLSSMLRKDE